MYDGIKQEELQEDRTEPHVDDVSPDTSLHNSPTPRLVSPFNDNPTYDNDFADEATDSASSPPTSEASR